MRSVDSLWKNKYRIATSRKTDWHYSSTGAYFVTWCVKDRLNCLSQITQSDVVLSSIGNIVDEEWHATAQRRNHIQLDAWVIMPNHVHGIIFIQHDGDQVNQTMTSRLFAQSLGAVIGQIKSACSKRIWLAGNSTFAWQSRFYDRILPNENAINAARTYIANNPSQWDLDRKNEPGIFM